MNPLYQSMNNFNPNKFWDTLQRFKKSFNGDPNQTIQQLLNSGKVSQAQYDRAVQQAQQIENMLKKRY
jgi:hypothetical protein